MQKNVGENFSDFSVSENDEKIFLNFDKLLRFSCEKKNENCAFEINCKREIDDENKFVEIPFIFFIQKDGSDAIKDFWGINPEKKYNREFLFQKLESALNELQNSEKENYAQKNAKNFKKDVSGKI